MIDLSPIKSRLDRTLSELYEAADHGDSVSLSLAEVEVMADDVRALVAEVERLRKQVLGSIGASARELSWRARYMDQLAIVAELQAELRERQRKDRAMLDFRATAKEAGIAGCSVYRPWRRLHG